MNKMSPPCFSLFKTRALFFTLFLLVIVFSLQESFARPGYAIKHRINQCTACHFSPAGGGARNVNGKYYGARNYSPPKLSSQDLFSSDVRSIYYLPRSSAEHSGGLGVMAVNLSGSLPIKEAKKENETEIRLNLTHNLGGFPSGSGGPRDAFIRVRFMGETETSWLPKHIIFGRFITPFGILTDEHRTYTKLQTTSSWNDFEMGALFSGDPFDWLHYDLTLSNGAKTGGTSFSVDGARLWGGGINLRWMPSFLPFALGASTTYHPKAGGASAATATAFYSMLSFDRLTSHFFDASLVFEAVFSRYWNSNINNFFSNSTYQSSVENSPARGFFIQLDWDLSSKIVLTYKFDLFAPNTAFPSDFFRRHGAGVKYYFGPNLFAAFRAETAYASHPLESNGSSTGALDAAWVLLQLSI